MTRSGRGRKGCRVVEEGRSGQLAFESSEEFARKAGADEILAARRSGLVEIDGFVAGGVKKGA